MSGRIRSLKKRNLQQTFVTVLSINNVRDQVLKDSESAKMLIDQLLDHLIEYVVYGCQALLRGRGPQSGELADKTRLRLIRNITGKLPRNRPILCIRNRDQ